MRRLLVATNPAKPVLWGSTVVVLLALSPAVSGAALIIGNLDAGDAADTSAVVLNASDQFAASFTMGSEAFFLTNVRTRLTFSPPNSTRFQLQSDAAGAPSGTVLVAFDNPAFFSGPLTYTFTPDAPFTLAENTTYWLVGSTLLADLDAHWVDSSPLTDPTGSGATFGSYLDSSNGGASWNATVDKPKFEVNGTAAAPEPSSLVLAGTIACVAAAVSLRRRQIRPVAMVS